jgi:outer membrane lipoprotein-sorting protein
MRTWMLVLVAVAVVGPAGLACAQPPLVNPTGAGSGAEGDARSGAETRGAPAAAADPEVDRVLDALDARGRSLNQFAADVTLSEIDDATQAESQRTGRVWYQKRQGNDRIRVTFDKKAEGRFVKAEKVEYLLDGGWLVDRDYRRSIEVKRQVLRPGEKINLLKLGEGPFPLPIGQPKAEVHREFEVSRGDPALQGPKGAAHVALRPREGTRLARKFAQIDVWVDPRTQMPVRIEALDANETTRRTTELKNIRVNPEPALGDRDFALPKVDESKWELHTEPYEE